MTWVDTLVFAGSLLIGFGLAAVCRRPRFGRRAEWWLTHLGMWAILVGVFFGGHTTSWMGAGLIAGAAACLAGQFGVMRCDTVRVGRPDK